MEEGTRDEVTEDRKRGVKRRDDEKRRKDEKCEYEGN